MVYLTVNGEKITTTTEHPFYVKGKGWVRAKNLLDTDSLVCYNGNELKIDSIQIEYAENAVQTYNFEVEGNHNYYVGDASVLAHNVCNVEMHMSKRDAVKYGKEFLGDGYTRTGLGNYRSTDGLRTMRFDFTHHVYKGSPSAPHINLEVWKNPVSTGVRNKLLANTHIFFT